MSKIREITGTITLEDGSTSEFSITADLGWQQWGATQARLGRTVDALETMTEALGEDIVSDEDEED